MNLEMMAVICESQAAVHSGIELHAKNGARALDSER